MHGSDNALPSLYYFGAFALGLIFAIAVIAALSLFVTVNFGVASLAALGVGTCAALLARLVK